VLAHIFTHGPLALSSNYGREYAKHIAVLASIGAISCIDLEGNATRQWRPTLAGITLLEQYI
jgi:hypothetical protein